MSLPKNDHTAVGMRIANFSNLEPALNHVLKLDSHDVPSILKELRKYADLPYGYLFTADQIELVTNLLLELKKIRSTCFPYALFLIDGSGLNTANSEFAETGADVIRIDSQNPQNAEQVIIAYAQKRFAFDTRQLKINSSRVLPCRKRSM
jgi:hypothetical protein